METDNGELLNFNLMDVANKQQYLVISAGHGTTSVSTYFFI